MKQLTENDLTTLRDSFLNPKGEVVGSVEVDDAVIFPIGAGPWPNEFPEAVRAKCAACDEFVGISPKGLDMHNRNRNRPIFCPSCFVTLYNLMAQRKDGPADA